MSVGYFSSAKPDWDTPPEVVARVVELFGEIDCNPCSGSTFNVPARVHYTAEDDGLTRDWLGNVYMNPPYGRTIGQWIDKAFAELVDDRIDSIVMLLPARWYRKWWRLATSNADGIAIIRGRLTFSGWPAPAPFPSAVLYFGPDVPSFQRVFAPAVRRSLPKTGYGIRMTYELVTTTEAPAFPQAAIQRTQDHRYYYQGVAYPGVTGILNVLDKSGSLMSWAARNTAAGGAGAAGHIAGHA